MTGSTWAERYYILGWIDSVEPLAIGQRGYNSRIKWHVDYYLTGEYWRFEALRQQEPSRLLYAAGAGRIKRGPDSLARPDPSSPRKWKVSSVRFLFYNESGSNQPWFVIAQTYNNGTYTSIRYIYWKQDLSYTYQGTTYHSMNTNESFMGYADEYLGIDPDTIIGMWASPVNPFWIASGVGTIRKDTHFAYVVDQQHAYPVKHTMDLRDGGGNGLTADDYHKIHICDPTGAIYGSIPWGYTVSQLYAFVDIGSANANLVVSFDITAINQEIEYLTQTVEGLTVCVPLPSVPITSNAKSSYVYSGEREYDQTTRALQRQESAVQGIAGAGNTAIGGAIAGAMIGGPAGALAGGLIGLGTSVIGTATGAVIGQEYDKKVQEAVDKLKSNQAANVMNMSGGNAWHVCAGRYWSMITTERDAVSAAELTAEQSELGYITDTYAADCSTIISQGGGLRIEGLEVKGGISREGREYIAALFARGVHIDILT